MASKSITLRGALANGIFFGAQVNLMMYSETLLNHCWVPLTFHIAHHTLVTMPAKKIHFVIFNIFLQKSVWFSQPFALTAQKSYLGSTYIQDDKFNFQARGSPAVKKTMLAWSIMLSAKIPWKLKIMRSAKRIVNHRENNSHILPTLHWLWRLSSVGISDVGREDHVNLISELRHGGQDEHHCREHHHTHWGEGIQLKNVK